jgi:uncharacterized Zn-finger protein
LATTTPQTLPRKSSSPVSQPPSAHFFQKAENTDTLKIHRSRLSSPPVWPPNPALSLHYHAHSVSLDETFIQPSSQESEISVASNTSTLTSTSTSTSGSSSQSIWVSCSPANSPVPRTTALLHPKRKRRAKRANGSTVHFPCSKCTCTFARARDLTRHFRLHTGERPYECLGCGERFIRVDARKRHWAARPTCSEIHQRLS